MWGITSTEVETSLVNNNKQQIKSLRVLQQEQTPRWNANQQAHPKAPFAFIRQTMRGNVATTTTEKKLQKNETMFALAKKSTKTLQNIHKNMQIAPAQNDEKKKNKVSSSYHLCLRPNIHIFTKRQNLHMNASFPVRKPTCVTYQKLKTSS